MTDLVQFIETYWMLLLPLLLIQLILIIVALIDWMRTEKTNGPKWLWLVIILIVNIIGPVLYFLIGRRQE